MRPGEGKRRNKRLTEPFRKRAKRFLSKRLKTGLAFGSVVAIFVSGAMIYKDLTTTPYLAIEAINVAGVYRVKAEEVITLAGIRSGQNMLSFKKAAAIEGIKTQPWVAEAFLKRGLPSTINIDIKEREPLALIQLDDMYVMDTRGAIFKRYVVEDSLDLPVVTGLRPEDIGNEEALNGLIELMAVLRGRQGFNISSVSEIHYARANGFSVYTMEDGVMLIVGGSDFEERLVSFEKVLKARGGALKGVEAMDLTNPASVIVRLQSTETKEGGEANEQKG